MKDVHSALIEELISGGADNEGRAIGEECGCRAELPKAIVVR